MHKTIRVSRVGGALRTYADEFRESLDTATYQELQRLSRLLSARRKKIVLGPNRSFREIAQTIRVHVPADSIADRRRRRVLEAGLEHLKRLKGTLPPELLA